MQVSTVKVTTGLSRVMWGLTIASAVVFMSCMQAQSRSGTDDPETIVPLPDKLDIEMPAANVPAEIARFHGGWVGTWGDEIRHILIVERVQADGHANVVFAVGDSATYGFGREWWRTDATIENGTLTIAGFRTLRYAFDGPDRLFQTSTLKSGRVTSGILVRYDAARLAAGERPKEWPWPGERLSVSHITARTADGSRPIALEATFYPALTTGRAPLAIVTHGSDVGRDLLKSFSFWTEAHWLRDKGFAVLVLMRRGRGKSEGIYGEDDYGRDHDGNIIDCSKGITEGIEDLESAIDFGRRLPGVESGPVLLVGNSRGGFLSVRYAGLKPTEVLGVINFSGGWVPVENVTKPYFVDAGRGARAMVPQLWLYADNDNLYSDALVRSSYEAFAEGGGSARFELMHGVPGDGHLLRFFPDRWEPIADQFLMTLGRHVP
jgi:dienelactone hydrolase